MEILEGTDLAAAVMALFEAPGRLRCAVAFWGPGLARLARKRKAEVVLDISMGGTSRNALKALGLRKKRLPDENVRTTVLDGLHAKIFLGEQYAIVGSANASFNALGGNGHGPVLKEAGVRIGRTDDPAAYRHVKEIYKQYRRLSRAITPDDFDRAVPFSTNLAARDRSADVGSDNTSLFQALLDRPEAFSRAAFIFGDDDINTKDWEEAKAAFVEEVGEDTSELNRSHICTTYDDPDTDLKLRGAFQIVTFWFGRHVGLHAHRDVIRIEHGNKRVSYFGRKGWPTACSAFGMSKVLKDVVWQRDMKLADSIAKSEDQDRTERFVALTAGELFERLEGDLRLGRKAGH